MRSVGSTASVFFLESFIDELANAANIDPYQYRRKLLAHDARAIAVLDAVVTTAGWETPPANDTYRGIAFNLYTGRGGAFETYVAIVAEVQIVKGSVAVKRVGVRGRYRHDNQSRSGQGEHRRRHWFCADKYFQQHNNFAGGEVEQSNFHDYPLLTMSEMPQIEVVLMDSDRPPQGCGEVALPPVAPAVASAIYKGTKVRLRSMPLPRQVTAT